MLRDTFVNANTSTKLYSLFGCIITLFVCSVFFVFLPFYEQDLIKSRRDSLTDTLDLATSLVAEYQTRVDKGEFSLEEAQKRAAARLRNMRYGNNEYFWINDEYRPVRVERMMIRAKNGTPYESRSGPKTPSMAMPIPFLSHSML